MESMYGLNEFVGDHPVRNARNELELIDLIRENPFRKSMLVKIAKRLGLTIEQQAQIYGVTLRTYKKKSRRSFLSFRVSEHVALLIELNAIGVKYFGYNEASFRHWINRESLTLGYWRPIELLTSLLGIDLIKKELFKMVHGIPP